LLGSLPSSVEFKGYKILNNQTGEHDTKSSPENTVFAFKEIFGQRYDAMHDNIKYYPFTIESIGQNIVHKLSGQSSTKTPEQILTWIFNKITLDIQNKIGQKTINTVVSIPTFFDNNQRKRLKQSID